MNKKELYNKILQLDGLTNEEKSELLGLLRKQKKYGLVWEDKPEDVEERLRDELPVLIEDATKAIISDDAGAPNHILIEGDNLEALTALAYTHEGKMRVYVFSPSEDPWEGEFEEVAGKVQLCALPQTIYNVYKRILPKKKDVAFEQENKTTDKVFDGMLNFDEEEFQLFEIFE